MVTADGVVRTANSNTNSDLFWAMRGGGGGVWGVVTETVYQVHPSTQMISVLYTMNFLPTISEDTKDAAIADFVSQMALYQQNWTVMGWSGYNFVTKDSILFTQFLPSSDSVAAQASMQPMIDYLNSKQLTYWTAAGSILPPTPDFETWRAAVLNTGKGQTPVAYTERLASRLIPYTSMKTPAGRTQLGQDIAAAFRYNSDNSKISAADQQFRYGQESLQIYATGPKPSALGGPSGADTGVNTAWRSSLWEIVIDSTWTYGMSQAGANTLAQQTSDAATKYLRKYGTGTYYSESDVLEPNWQTAFFGDNYARLLKVKKKYDPDNVFIVWKGIGFAGQENQSQYQCYKNA